MRRTALSLVLLSLACGGSDVTPSPAPDAGVDVAVTPDAGPDVVTPTDGAAPDVVDAAPTCTDLDGDGYGVGPACDPKKLDCDDTNPLVNPRMAELADDGLDNDCQGGDLKAATGPGYYVDGSNPSCSDTLKLGTKAQPYCSVAMAVLDAYQNTPINDPVGRSIFVAKGTYPLQTGTPKSMRVYGGYDGTTWKFDPVANETIIGGNDFVEDLDSRDCRIQKNCTGQCVCLDNGEWFSINVDANVVLKSFTFSGGNKPSHPLKMILVNSTGHVEITDSKITNGKGLQNVAIDVAVTANDTWLIRNRLHGGVPAGSGASASVFAVNSHGKSTLWGNVIESGPGAAGSVAVGVQNYGTMRLVANVINPGDQGGLANDSYGYLNLQQAQPPRPGIGFAVHNVIYGGRGVQSSRGVLSNSPLDLVDNVLGDRTSIPLDWSKRPTTGSASALDVGFSSTTTLQNNLFHQLVYTNEPNPPNVAANRHLVIHSKQTTAYLELVGDVNTCTWTGCKASSANLVGTPGFVDPANDFHLALGSPCIDKGITSVGSMTDGLGLVDVDRELRPKGPGFDIGVDEK
jgi:hypothetical protein